MYQHLRQYVDPTCTGDQDTRSIHFMMLPEPKYDDDHYLFYYFPSYVFWNLMFSMFFFREYLIQKKIESAVSQMQTVINLGRIVRDRNTMPARVSQLVKVTGTIVICICHFFLVFDLVSSKGNCRHSQRSILLGKCVLIEEVHPRGMTNFINNFRRPDNYVWSYDHRPVLS